MGCHFLLQCMKVKSESEIVQSAQLLATPWTAAYQAPLSMGFSRQEYWSGLPLPSPVLYSGSIKLGPSCVLLNVQGQSESGDFKCPFLMANPSLLCCQSWFLEVHPITPTPSLPHLGNTWLLLKEHFSQCMALSSAYIPLGLLNFLFGCKDILKSLFKISGSSFGCI